MDQDYMFSITTKLMELYGYYRKKWVMIYKKKSENEASFRTRNDMPLDGAMMQLHLMGNISVGAFAGPAATKFISIDVDYNDPNVVHYIINTMVDMGIPRDKIYVSTSGKKGFHIDIFFRDKMYNNRARMFYILLIDRTGLDPHKIEFTPTFGRAIKVPLGLHQGTKKRCWYLDRDTLEPIESFDEVFKIELIEEELMNDIVRRLGNEYLKKLYSEVDQRRQDVSKVGNLPADLKVTKPGTRHKLQVKVAILARQRGSNRNGIYYAQMEWYRAQDKSLISSDEKEVMRDAGYIANWAFEHVAPVQLADQVVSKQAPKISITGADIPYILNASTPTARRLALLIWIYCRRYGEAKLAMNTMADKVNKSKSCVINAINSLVEDHIIIKKEKEIDRKAAFYIKQTNVYLLPKRLCRKRPGEGDLYCSKVEVDEWVTKDTLDGIYYKVLSMCKPEYLVKYLTKTEMKEVEVYINGS